MTTAEGKRRLALLEEAARRLRDIGEAGKRADRELDVALAVLAVVGAFMLWAGYGPFETLFPCSGIVAAAGVRGHLLGWSRPWRKYLEWRREVGLWEEDR